MKRKRGSAAGARRAARERKAAVARARDVAETGGATPARDDERAWAGEPRARLSRGRRLLFLAVPYALFLVALVSVEACTRLVLPRASVFDAWVDSPQQRMGLSDREQVSIFEGDPLLLWRLKPNLDHVVWDFTVVSTNARGLRYAGEVGPKARDALRIVCLGDSVTFGYRVPVVWPERPKDFNPEWLPYPALLEKALRAANPSRTIEVIPLAVPGYTSHQGLAWLRRDIDELRPDLVIICFGWNDVNLSAQPDKQTMTADWPHIALRRAMSYSQALTHAALWLKQRRAPAPSNSSAATVTAPTQRVPLEDYVSNMMEAARLARTHGAQALIIGPVYRDRVRNPPEAALIAQYRAGLRAAAGGAGVPYLEVRELTEDNYPANEALFGELIHPNHLGHRLLANAILKFLAATHALRETNVPQGLDGGQ